MVTIGIWGNIVSAQSTPKQYLLRMNETYARANSLTMNVELLYFMGTNDVTPVQVLQGKMAQSGASYYSALMGKTTIKHKGKTLFIDDSQQLILYGEYDQKNTQDEVTAIPDTVTFGQEAVYSFGKPTATCVRIVVVPHDKQVYKRIELLINKQTYALEETIYGYTMTEDNDDPLKTIQTVKIRYSSIHFNQPVPADIFSSSRFITRKKGKLIGVGIYAGYQVIEQPTYTLPQ